MIMLIIIIIMVMMLIKTGSLQALTWAVSSCVFLNQTFVLIQCGPTVLEQPDVTEPDQLFKCWNAPWKVRQLVLVWTHFCAEKGRGRKKISLFFFFLSRNHKGKLAQWNSEAFISLQFVAWSQLKYSVGLGSHPDKLYTDMSSVDQPNFFSVWNPRNRLDVKLD